MLYWHVFQKRISGVSGICHNFDTIDSTTIKSPLKWAGGKYRLLDTIFRLFPETASAFHEPFFGGGSVGLNAMKRLNAGVCFVGDTNSCLVQFWNALKEQPEDFVAMAKTLFVPSGRLLKV